MFTEKRHNWAELVAEYHQEDHTPIWQAFSADAEMASQHYLKCFHIQENLHKLGSLPQNRYQVCFHKLAKTGI